MAKSKVRPAQGQNSTKKIVKLAAGGSNVKIIPATNRNNKRRGYA